jgi:four helix bundle protein
MAENVIKVKSFDFAVRIIKLYKTLATEQKEFVLSKQLLRSGTSVGANVREALNGQSKADFIHKLSIAQKESDESLYWLELLKETHYITEIEFNNLSADAIELLKIIRSIILTSKSKRNP